MKLPTFIKQPLNAGICISFFGTLPIGILNSCVFSLSYSQSIWAGFSFATGVTIVEMLYLYASLQILTLMNWNARQERWIYLGMTLFLAVCSYLVVLDLFHANSSFNERIHEINSPFVAGLSLSAANMLQIPFWVGWNLILKNMGILNGTTASKHKYLLGSGVGTLAGFAVFVVLGTIAQKNVEIHPMAISTIVAGVFVSSTILAAIKSIQLFKKERKNVIKQTA